MQVAGTEPIKHILFYSIEIEKERESPNPSIGRKMSEAEAETLVGILDEIESLVSDKLQLVSFKWLAFNLSVSSNTAKRLLQEFVQTHKQPDGLQVVYSLSGCLKADPSHFHVRLVPAPLLQEAKRDFHGPCSVQVYSVQTLIPKDPVSIWNSESAKAKELFAQPLSADNCLRDNRFCGVFNSFVRRNLQAHISSGSDKSALKTEAAVPPQPTKLRQTNQKDGQHSANVTAVKCEDDPSANLNQVSKPTAEKINLTSLSSDKKLGHNNKTAAGAGGSLANLWGRASTKSKDSKLASVSAGTTAPDSTACAEAQICTSDAAQLISDDEAEGVNFRRTVNSEGGRKRRVVFDFSDEENEYEDAVNLASPDFPEVGEDQVKDEKANIDSDETKEDKLKVKKEESSPSEVHQRETSVSDTDRKHAVPTIEKVPSSEINSNGKVNSALPTSPRRRKVLKTRIDERGREVTEVIWEGEETDKSTANSATMKKENNEAGNRPPVAKKPLKKGGSKDPKQGNIMSFFKRV